LSLTRIRESGRCSFAPSQLAERSQKQVAGNPGDAGDRDREPAGEPDRAGDLTGDEQQHERHDREHEATDRREDEGTEGREPGSVGLVAAAAEVAELDDAGTRRREQLTREVRREVRLAAAPEAEAGQERAIDQRLAGHAGKAEGDQNEDFPSVELRQRLPDVVVVYELRQHPPEHDEERDPDEHRPERTPPQRPSHEYGSGLRHQAIRILRR
jgi:hypothetical protein